MNTVFLKIYFLCMNQVLNFFELRNNVLIKTIPLMEELHSVILCNATHTGNILASCSTSLTSSVSEILSSSNVSKHVVISAGERGVLHVACVSMMVCLYLFIPLI